MGKTRWIVPMMIVVAAQAVVYADKKPTKKPVQKPPGKKGPLWEGTFLFDSGNGPAINLGVTQCSQYFDPVPPACKQLYADAEAQKHVIAPPACVRFTDTNGALLCPTACGNMSQLVITNDTMTFDIQYVPEGTEDDKDRPRETRHFSIPINSKNRESFAVDTTIALAQPLDIVKERHKKHLTEAHVMAGFGVMRGHCQPSGFEENGRSIGLRVELQTKGATDFTLACDLNTIGKDFTLGAFCGEGHQCHTSGWSCHNNGDCCSGDCVPLGHGFKGGKCRGG